MFCVKMELTQEEKEILEGSQGPVMQKVLHTIVAFGDLFGAKCLVPIDGPIHFVNTTAITGLDVVYDILDELIDAGIKTLQPFTSDPYPMDFENIVPTLEQKEKFYEIYGSMDKYKAQLLKLGLKDETSFSCACYLPETGNIPAMGQNLAWAESSAVVYANSVLGARTNRNSALIELFCGIVGKAPKFGFLTDDGRKATWLVEVKTSSVPNASVLGSVIGKKMVEDVPYITGLDQYLNEGLSDAAKDYLKDMGASTASNGAVGLFHVENLTPEAVWHGRKLLVENYKTYVIDDEEIEKTKKTYPILWSDAEATPSLCLIGCPHLSLRQIFSWYNLISDALAEAKKDSLAVKTVLLASPKVIEKFKRNDAAFKRLTGFGVSLSVTCPIMYMLNPECARHPVITNSNKARTYSTARFFEDEKLVEIIISGSVKGA